MDADIFAIERLLSDFAWHADRGDGTSLSELFVPDGILRIGALELKGQLQIAEDCRRRFLQPGRKTRHVWSNLRVELTDTDEATTFAVQLTFEQSGAGSATQCRVSDLLDKFQKNSQGVWRFASRVIKRELTLNT
jgi:hypothetical protein